MMRDFRAQREAAVAPEGLALDGGAFLFSADPTCARPWHPDHFTHLSRDLATTIGIDEPLKNLRHFNATQLLAAGVDLRTTAGRLGHGDGGATTLKVYSSWTQPVDRLAADNLSRDLMRLRQTASGPVAAKRADLALNRLAKPVDEVLSHRAVSTYHGIAAALREALREGRLASGDVIPTLSELADFFGVTRSTIQRAIAAEPPRACLRGPVTDGESHSDALPAGLSARSGSHVRGALSAGETASPPVAVATVGRLVCRGAGVHP